MSQYFIVTIPKTPDRQENYLKKCREQIKRVCQCQIKDWDKMKFIVRVYSGDIYQCRYQVDPCYQMDDTQWQYHNGPDFRSQNIQPATYQNINQVNQQQFQPRNNYQNRYQENVEQLQYSAQQQYQNRTNYQNQRPQNIPIQQYMPRQPFYQTQPQIQPQRYQMQPQMNNNQQQTFQAQNYYQPAQNPFQTPQIPQYQNQNWFNPQTPIQQPFIPSNQFSSTIPTTDKIFTNNLPYQQQQYQPQYQRPQIPNQQLFHNQYPNQVNQQIQYPNAQYQQNQGQNLFQSQQSQGPQNYQFQPPVM
ncbi:Hypothetical_protein [Hexamita inflata]|uniref:Hypothetical_protein n=1 Tax=Hexamita inflata TaxID=28002 RepID=A0AA86Q0B6_9EUKA|nr:Hypothetical protein HINF_LOCUS37026 [Hexamita inflata]